MKEVVQKRTRREINRRVQNYGPGADRQSLRDTVRDTVCGAHRILWLNALGKDYRGSDGLGRMSADEMSDLLYAVAWCRAWRRDLGEYIREFGVKGFSEAS